MKREEVANVINTKYKRYTAEVLNLIKALPPECRQSGDDSGLKNVWEEWKAQVQEEHSVFYESYEETIRSLCYQFIESLPEEERALLWHYSEAYFDRDDTLPDPTTIVDDLTEEFFNRIWGIAADEDLESSDKEEMDEEIDSDDDIYAGADTNAIWHRERTISFPDHHSLGEIYLCDPGSILDQWNRKTGRLGAALGRITVPAGKRLTLRIRGEVDRLHLIATLPHDAIQGINFFYSEVTDRGLPFLHGQVTLQAIDLSATKTTDAGLAYLQHLNQIEELDLCTRGITDAGVAYLRNLGRLKELNLCQTKTTDMGLQHLSGLKSLQTLKLIGTQITDAGLIHLRGLTGLQRLSLCQTAIGDEGMSHLRFLTGLQQLNLSCVRLTDEGLAHFRDLARLQQLDLSGTEITDEGMRRLAGFHSLEELFLSGTQVGDRGIASLRGLRSLQRLDLSNTRVTDASLPYLRELENLAYLELSFTAITDAGVASLKKALPDCLINKQVAQDAPPDARQEWKESIKPLAGRSQRPYGLVQLPSPPPPDEKTLHSRVNHPQNPCASVYGLVPCQYGCTA